jgi:protein-disulfide isomerase
MSAIRAQLRLRVGPDDHVQGVADAPVTLLEYGDFQCPYCGEAYPIVKRLQDWMGPRLRFVFRNFPLAEIHPLATGAAEIAEAAAFQDKYWEMHDTLYENQSALEPDHLLGYAKRLRLDMHKLRADLGGADVAERVRADFMSGVRSGVNGTPTFFINEARFDGRWTDENEFAAALEEAAKAG